MDRCLVLKVESYNGSFEGRKEFDFIYAPHIMQVKEEQFEGSNVKQIYAPLLKEIV